MRLLTLLRCCCVWSDDRDLRARSQFVGQLQALVRRIHPRAQLHVFGSAAIPGLALKGSDLDLGITGLPLVCKLLWRCRVCVFRPAISLARVARGRTRRTACGTNC